ncbi:MAG: sugar transferase [Candidatus Woesearchaeota archaeon]
MKPKFWAGKKQWFFLVLYFSDLFSFVLSTCIASRLRYIDILDAFHVRFLLFAFLILMITYSSYNLYKNKRNLFDDTDLMKIIYSALITFFVLAAFIIIFDPEDLFLITGVMLILILSAAFTSVGRMILNTIILYARKKGYDIKNTAFFGNADEEMLEKLKNSGLGYNLIKVTNNLNELEKHIEKVDIVFVKTESINEKMLDFMIQHDRVNWKIVSSVLNLVIEPVDFDEFRDYPIINVSNKDSAKGYMVVKRIIDILLSGLALMILSPLFLIIIISMKITMPGPVFYKHERLGKNLKPFMLYKFRTMIIGADSQKAKLKNEVKGLFKMKDDPRITGLGKFMRRTCIDELPQLINIFRGDMSIVGPRPHLQSELHNFKGWRMARFKIKPGLTGLWQVNGRHELNFDKAVLYDIYYVKRMSLFLDIQIILKTIPAIIMTRGRY